MGVSMSKGRWFAALLGLMAAGAAAPAAAQDDSGIYLGAQAGWTHYYDSCKALAVPCEDRDDSWRAFGGYRFNKYVAAEIGYVDLGAASGSGTIGGQPADFTVRNKAWDATAVVTVPIANRLSALGRFGIFQTRTTLDTRIGAATDHSGSTNHNYAYGAGLQYTLGKLGVRAEWIRYDNAGTNGTTVEDDLDFWSVGLFVQF
jgi:OOP family OmpA-OmpF porin